MSENMIAQQMRRADILSNLTDKQLVQIAVHADRKLFNSGDIIAKKGERSSCTTIIVDGNFSCTEGIAEGKEFTEDVNGTVIGEMAMFTNDFEHPSTFVAASRVKALLLDREMMIELMEDDRDLAERFINKVSSRLKEISSMVSSVEEILQDYGQSAAKAA